MSDETARQEAERRAAQRYVVDAPYPAHYRSGRPIGDVRDAFVQGWLEQAAQPVVVTAEQVWEAYNGARMVPLVQYEDLPGPVPYHWRERDRVLAMLAALGITVTEEGR